MTDTNSIVTTANNVDQKSGAAVDTPPNQPVPNTTLTAVDGSLTTAGSGGGDSSSSSSTSRRRIFSKRSTKRSPPDYEVVFLGTGTGPHDRDAAIEGTAYLTYTLVSNATYDVDDCLNKCDQIETCGKFPNFIYIYSPPRVQFFNFFFFCL